MKTIAQQLNVTEFPFEIRDKNSNKIYFENSNGYWRKSEYDENRNVIYYENSHGEIVDNRPKSIVEFTMEELTKILGKPFKIVK